MIQLFNVISDLKYLAEIFCMIVERPRDGEKKKAEVMDAVQDFIDKNDLPIPEPIIEDVIDFLIEHVVGKMNNSIKETTEVH
ncbi:MAG: hypothetical protein DRP50_04510 [Thermotoga sp.]|nr:hypothetical protein [Thermotogota bacterium]RKX54338.1 MAG: hypothetical protein DRP50_04510 [Thermotoga sp.]